MYSVRFTEHAERQLKKLERDIQERIIKVLERICVRPQEFLEKLVGEPGFKLRVGDYRAYIDLDNKDLIVLVLKVGHRKNFYKN